MSALSLRLSEFAKNVKSVSKGLVFSPGKTWKAGYFQVLKGRGFLPP